jgi:hypothetical protein
VSVPGSPAARCAICSSSVSQRAVGGEGGGLAVEPAVERRAELAQVHGEVHSAAAVVGSA